MNAHTGSLHKIDAVGIAGCLALVGVAYLSGFAPLLRERADRQSQRTALTERQQQVSALQESLRGLAERRRIYDAELASHPVKLHPASDLIKRLGSIVRLADECGLKILDNTTQASKTDQRFTVIPIVLKGTGGYPTAGAFFAGLHREFKDMAVTAFTLTAVDQATEAAAPGGSANVVGPEPVPAPARADFVFELSWFAAPSDRAGAVGK